MDIMESKQDEMIKDAVDNLAVRLPISQAAKLHSISRQRASQILKQNGIMIDRSDGTLTIPISRLKTITKLR